MLSGHFGRPGDSEPAIINGHDHEAGFGGTFFLEKRDPRVIVLRVVSLSASQAFSAA